MAPILQDLLGSLQDPNAVLLLKVSIFIGLM